MNQFNQQQFERPRAGSPPPISTVYDAGGLGSYGSQSSQGSVKNTKPENWGLRIQSNFMNPLVSNQISLNPRSLGKAAIDQKFFFGNISAESVDNHP